jgi:NAD(P)-dependent dehydrogenase (short-subunit alcohol dehydrogenase family)
MARVLFITGGATGIGAASAREAARSGYAVAINYRTHAQAAAALVDELRRAGARAMAVAGDVTNPEQVASGFDAAEAELGPISALINSAATFLPPTRVADADAEGLVRLLQTNVLGVMLCCREAARRMSTARGGAGGVVVNVSSMAATIGGRAGNAHYAASKAAVDAFSIGFAKEVAPEGIRVVSVRPGFTETDATARRLDDAAFRSAISATIPLGRPARVEEVALPIVWLLSDAASFITGSCLDISGGGFNVGPAESPPCCSSAPRSP